MSTNKEIEESLDQQHTTKRAISPGVEELLYKPIPVLDKGFIRVVDYMGDDSAIVQAARVSYGKGTKQTNQDRRGLYARRLNGRHWETNCQLL